jgi:DNA-binding MarR family transcriptional regulator
MPAEDPNLAELAKADYEALAAFRLALRRFLAFSDAAIREKGITPQQHQALLAIKASPEERLTIGALAEALLLQHHSCVELANRLEAAGLVTRAPAADDRRKVFLELTPEAGALLAGLATTHLRELAGIRPLLAQALQGLDARRGE